MYYITVEFYEGEIFKYIAGTEREANFFRSIADAFSYTIKHISIINLYKKENTENDD